MSLPNNKMRKKITIKSHCTPVCNTREDILVGKYKAVPAAFAIEWIFETLIDFNLLESRKKITPSIKEVQETKAELILNGRRKELDMFITSLVTDTKLTKAFDLTIDHLRK